MSDTAAPSTGDTAAPSTGDTAAPSSGDTAAPSTGDRLLGDAPPGSVLATLRRTAHAAPQLVAGIRTTFLLALLGSAGLLAAPLVVQRLLDVHLLSDVPLDLAAVLRLGALGLVAGLAGAGANQRAVQRMMTATAEAIASLRVQALDRLHALPVLEVQAERRGALVARVTTDLDVVTQFVGWGGVGFAVGAVRVTAALAAVGVVEWRLLVVLLPPLAVYALALGASQRLLQRAHDRVRGHVATSLGAVGEAVSGLPTIRAYGAEHRTRERVGDALEEQFRAEYRVGVLGAVLFSSAEVFAAVLTAVAVAGGVLIAGGTALSAGEVVAVLFLVTLLLDPVQTMVETIHEAQSAGAGLRRVLHLLQREPEDRVGDPLPLPAGALGVRIDRVTFAYPGGEPVLVDVRLDVEPGSHVAIVGTTGSGKTTLAKVVVRLLRARAGRVELGGVALERVATDELRHRVAFVPQEGFLFDGTVLENLRVAAPALTVEGAHEAAVRLGVDGWLLGLADGLATDVGERGGRLSAGERQLVALLRAALRSPDLLVLDEATSAVDPALEVALRTAIERLGTGRTVVTIAHRLSTAEAADHVVVMARGRVVEQGTHTALVAAGGAYAHLHADWESGTATPTGQLARGGDA